MIIAAIQSVSVAGNIEENIAHHVRLAKTAANRGAEFILFPELSLTGYELATARETALRCSDPRLGELRALAMRGDATIVVGAPIKNDRGHLFIASLVFRPDGQLDCYTKQHLHAGEADIFTVGDGGEILEIREERIALAVCADISRTTHPETAAKRGASIYAASVLISDNGYATDTGLLLQYAQQYDMQVMMANHGAATGGWKPAGRSAIWDTDGEQIVAAPGVGEYIILAKNAGNSWHGQVVAGPI